MTRRFTFLAVLAILAVAGCGERSHSRTDAGPPADAGGRDAASCDPIRCAPPCYSLTGPDGCPVCRCDGPECAADADCVVAGDLRACCGECGAVYPRSRVLAEECIARPGDRVPTACLPTSCEGIMCPADPCPSVTRGVCAAGACTAVHDCPSGHVEFLGECAPACAAHADCILASVVASCCGNCERVFPRALAADRPCIVPAGDTPPAGCAPDPAECALVDCPDIFCAGGHAACMADGQCMFVESTDTCPAGTMDVDGRCVPI